MIGRLDAHHHLWRYTSEDFDWITPEMGSLRQDFLPADLSREMSGSEVVGSVAVQARQSIEETTWLLECAASNPWIKGVVGWAPIAAVNFGTLLDGLLATSKKLKGLRHVIQDEPDDDFILSDDFNSGIASMLGTGLVYDILIHERHLERAAKFARRHPQQIFVLDHMAKPRIRAREIDAWETHLTALASCPNVFCKLSGLATEADWSGWTLDDLSPYLDVALSAFGPKRLMVGSDWPVCLLATGYRRWWDTVQQWAQFLGSEEQDAVFGGTTWQVYHLDDNAGQPTEFEVEKKGAA